MKNQFIYFLENLLQLLGAGEVFPVQRLNYRRCIESINAQSLNGKRSFYAILVSNIDKEDKLELKKLLEEDAKK